MAAIACTWIGGWGCGGYQANPTPATWWGVQYPAFFPQGPSPMPPSSNSAAAPSSWVPPSTPQEGPYIHPLIICACALIIVRVFYPEIYKILQLLPNPSPAAPASQSNKENKKPEQSKSPEQQPSKKDAATQQHQQVQQNRKEDKKPEQRRDASDKDSKEDTKKADKKRDSKEEAKIDTNQQDASPSNCTGSKGCPCGNTCKENKPDTPAQEKSTNTSSRCCQKNNTTATSGKSNCNEKHSSPTVEMREILARPVSQRPALC